MKFSLFRRLVTIGLFSTGSGLMAAEFGLGFSGSPFPFSGGPVHVSRSGVMTSSFFDVFIDITPVAPSFFDVFVELDVNVPPLPTPPVFPIVLVSLQIQSVDPIPLEVGGVSYNVPILVRQTPGTTAMGNGELDGPPGHFRINSFFDVFVELSLDGGASWIPGDSPASIHTSPTPDAAATLWLMLGSLALVCFARHRPGLRAA